VTATTRAASLRSDPSCPRHRDSDISSTRGTEPEYGIVGSGATGTPLIEIATGARPCIHPDEATAEAAPTAFGRLVRADATETETRVDYRRRGRSANALISTRHPTHRFAVVAGSTPAAATVPMV
jgi:hypothetical protein